MQLSSYYEAVNLLYPRYLLTYNTVRPYQLKATHFSPKRPYTRARRLLFGHRCYCSYRLPPGSLSRCSVRRCCRRLTRDTPGAHPGSRRIASKVHTPTRTACRPRRLRRCRGRRCRCRASLSPGRRARTRIRQSPRGRGSQPGSEP